VAAVGAALFRLAMPEMLADKTGKPQSHGHRGTKESLLTQ
jgi:hypothetical protein